MRTVVSVNGRVTPPESAVVPALDRGFLYGDSVYEVLWWHRGTPIQAAEHLSRLRESARRIYMDVRESDAALHRAIDGAIAAAGVLPAEDAYVRLVVTRGEGPLGLPFDPARLAQNVVVIVAPVHRPTAAEWAQGVRVALVDRLRVSVKALDPGAKTGNYMNNLLALHEARARGADDAVLLNDQGEVTEGTTSNVYVVRGGRLPPAARRRDLKGPTRTRVALRARRRPRRGRRSSPRGPRAAAGLPPPSAGWSVTRIDDPPWPGVPGPVTTRVTRSSGGGRPRGGRRGPGASPRVSPRGTTPGHAGCLPLR